MIDDRNLFYQTVNNLSSQEDDYTKLYLIDCPYQKTMS